MADELPRFGDKLKREVAKDQERPKPLQRRRREIAWVPRAVVESMTRTSSIVNWTR
jgi:hypothetical protein